MDSSNQLQSSFVGFAPFEEKLSPVSVWADLHDAPGAAFLTFFKLIINDQLPRLQTQRMQQIVSPI